MARRGAPDRELYDAQRQLRADSTTMRRRLTPEQERRYQTIMAGRALTARAQIEAIALARAMSDAEVKDWFGPLTLEDIRKLECAQPRRSYAIEQWLEEV